VSKKRNKNARKKAVRRKALANPNPPKPTQDSRETAADSLWTGESPPEEEEVVLDAVAAKEGGGAINVLRGMVSPGRGGDGHTLLTKRRPVSELMVWLAGASAVVWLIWKRVRYLNPPI
jgi:hypothetical protein